MLFRKVLKNATIFFSLYLFTHLFSPEENSDDLYVHEAKLSMFISLAEVPHGAKAILENDVIRLLSKCDFIDHRPECTGKLNFFNFFQKPFLLLT